MITARRSHLVLAALVAATAVLHVKAAEPTPTNDFVVGAGGSDLGIYVLLAWTSPKRVGMYMRAFPFLYEISSPQSNSTVTDEEAWEVGIAVRANQWLTLGVGYARDKRFVTTYGDPDPFLGTPYSLGSETIIGNGVGAIAVFAIPSRSRTMALAISTSLSTVGSGIALGIKFGD